LEFSQATAQGLPAGRLVGCEGNDENRVHIVQLRALSNAARANKREIQHFRRFSARRSP
jgi:hypothetical protein